jgi:non-lysosomal glucosylceramidase
MTSGMRYERDHRRAVAMPLGGIGCGHVSVSGAGSLTQWQPINEGNHLGFLPQSFFALRVSSVEPPISYRRLLEAPPIDPPAEPAPLVNDDWDGRLHHRRPPRWPGVRSTVLEVAYPFARIEYEDEWPLDVRMEAYTPFVPLDADASALPLASFTFTLTNRFDAAITAWLFGSLQNIVGWDGVTPICNERCAVLGGNVNSAASLAGGTAVVMQNPSLLPEHAGAGSMTIWTGAAAIAFPQFDDIGAALAFVDSLKLLAPTVFEEWTPTAVRRSLAALRLPIAVPDRPSVPGSTWAGGLAIPLHLEPNTSASAEIVMAWHFPNRLARFDNFGTESEVPRAPAWVGNHYATRFSDAGDVVRGYAERRGALHRSTLLWSEALFHSSLPEVVKDVLSAQASFIRTPTTFRTADGEFFGFEGVLGESSLNWNGNIGGSCPLNCTHVWNYEQAISRLFPSLDRSMRAIDWEVLQAPSGALAHRVLLPLDGEQHHGRRIGGPTDAALDGMLGAILKTYREARQGAGLEWLAGYVPHMRRLIGHVRHRWDRDGSGVLTGQQPVTHDISLDGPNMYVGGLWLAALRTMQVVAGLIGQDAEATAYAASFDAASRAYDSLLWNGEYYTQVSEGAAFDYGAGCLSDQLLGQWWAHQLDLGYLLPRDHVRSALRSIVNYNLQRGFRNFRHGYRSFADADDCGLLNCTWPRGERPVVPIRYADEVWTGVEYQVAAHCLFEDMHEQALELLAAMRKRHDGSRRNPYNEIENGDHYARAMSGWSVLEAFTDARYDALERGLRVGRGVERYPLFAGCGWGEVLNMDDSINLRCHGGEIVIESLTIDDGGPGSAGIRVAAARIGDTGVSPLQDRQGAPIRFTRPLVLTADQTLTVDIARSRDPAGS